MKTLVTKLTQFSLWLHTLRGSNHKVYFMRGKGYYCSCGKDWF